LVKQANDSDISADSLPFDSWFAFPQTFIGLLEQKQQIISMLKSAKIRYSYNGLALLLNSLEQLMKTFGNTRSQRRSRKR
jgi:gamma-glutamylcysteine synthetase